MSAGRHGRLRVSMRGLVALVCLCAALAPSQGRADKPEGASAQTLKMPSGPTALKGLGESFDVSASTGTGAFSVPLTLAPAALAPTLSLSYAAGSGRSELGVSFQLPILTIYRQTDKGTPRFDENDRFAVRSETLNDELVLVDATRRLYRLKNEGPFALFERDVSGDRWRVRLPNGRQLELGASADARETSLGRTFRWYVTTERDRHGHAIAYHYFKENEVSGRVYLRSISYQLHAPEAYQNHVELEYEQRPDITMDASSGEAIVTSLRVREIAVRQGTRVLRRYHLRYQTDSLLSTLVEVELEGEQGERMPVLSFDYIQRSPSSGHFVQMRQLPPLEGLLNGNATLEDVTGDGLPDLLIGQAGAYVYYENLDGVSWSTVRTELNGDPERSLGDEDVVFADIDGDGARDVVYSYGSGFRYAPAGRVSNGVYEGFGATRTLSTLESGLSFGSPSVKLVDLDDDGRTDLLAQRPGQDVQILNEDGQRLVAHAMPELPLDVQLDDPRVELVDFNGDGVLDFVRKEIGYSVSRVRVWYGLGAGRYMAEQQMLGVPKADGSEFSFHDVNRDGQTDLVRMSGTTAAYYLNDGHGMFLPKQGPFRGLPSMADTQKLLFSDLNGNGTSDVVWLTRSGKLYYLDLVGEPFAGLLARVDNGMGLVTELAYRSSSDFAVDAKRAGKPWKTWLPHPVPVITEQRVSDSLDLLGLEANVNVTTFAYADGYWDGAEREFRGFGRVTTTEWGDAAHETLVTEQLFHLGRDFATGADLEALKGRPLASVQRNELGQIFASSESVWERRSLCRAPEDADMPLPTCDATAPVTAENKDRRVVIALSTRQLSGSWEKTSTPRFSAVETEYDRFGNATLVKKWGEVRVAEGYQPGSGFTLSDVSVGQDESFEQTDYLYNVGEWLLGFPYAARMTTPAGQLVAGTRTFYDDPYADRAGKDPANAASLSVGLSTVSQSWLAEEQRWVTNTRRAYDAHGLVTWYEDGTGQHTDLEHDPLTGLFATAEVQQAGSADQPTSLRYSAEYDRGLGEIVALVEPNGNRSRVEYDGLGRLIRAFNPRGQLVGDIAYEYGEPISRTVTRKLVDANTQHYVSAVTFSDGAGRVRLRKEEAEEPYGFVASGWQALSARGGAVRSYRAFASQTEQFEPAPSEAELQQVQLDALGRPVATWARTTAELERAYGIMQPFTQTAQLQYEPWTTVTFSERDLLEGVRSYPAITRVDAYGRPRTIERTNLGAHGVQKLSWQARYDLRGLLVSLEDASHERRYEYDSLGRLATVDDRNLGSSIHYRYDDAGRRTRREDGVGGVQAWNYDLAGRIVEHTVVSPGQRDASYRFHWDVSHPRFAELAGAPATQLAGRLAWTEFPTGATLYSYDFEGRLTTEVNELWNPELSGSTFAQQRRDAFIRRITYDDAGLPVQRLEGDRADTPEVDGVTLRMTYNARQKPVAVSGGFTGQEQTLFSGLTYRESGAAIGTDFGNGLRSCVAYDQRDLLARAVTDVQGAVSCNAIAYSGGHGIVNLGYRNTYENQLAAVDDLSHEVGNVQRLGAEYRYDRLGQLTGVDYEAPEQGSEEFEYDGIQNLVRRAQLSSGGAVRSEQRYTYNQGSFGAPQRLHQIVRDNVSTTFAYDALGQLSQYNDYALAYDGAGRLTSAARADGTGVEHHFDAMGARRISIARESDGSRRVERVISDGFSIRDGEEVAVIRQGLGAAELWRPRGLRIDAALLDELSVYVNAGGASAKLRKPLPDEYMDLNGDGSGDFDQADLALATQSYWRDVRAGAPKSLVRFMVDDHLGSTTHVTDRDGELVSHQRFLAYGEASHRGGVGAVFGFAGQRKDLLDIGLVHMGAREYAPQLGRWTAPDRVIGESPARLLASVLEANLYAYARNNPARFTDPAGGEAGECEDGKPCRYAEPERKGLVQKMIRKKYVWPSNFSNYTYPGDYEWDYSGEYSIWTSFHESPLTQRLIGNYVDGFGLRYTLTREEMGEVRPIFLYSPESKLEESAPLRAVLSELGASSGGGFRDGVTFQLMAQANCYGSLGRFRAHFSGRIVVGEGLAEGVQWMFIGTVRFTDVYDFKGGSSSKDPGENSRSDSGAFLTKVGDCCISGKAFKIDSEEAYVVVAAHVSNGHWWFDVSGLPKPQSGGKYRLGVGTEVSNESAEHKSASGE